MSRMVKNRMGPKAEKHKNINFYKTIFFLIYKNKLDEIKQVMFD